MQEKVEIITNHFENFWNYWTKILKNGYCGTLEKTLIDTHYSLLQSILRLAVPDHVSQKIRKQLDSL